MKGSVEVGWLFGLKGALGILGVFGILPCSLFGVLLLRSCGPTGWWSRWVVVWEGELMSDDYYITSLDTV